MKMHQIQVNNLNYSVRTWGKPSNPGFFLLHGFLDVGESFTEFVERMGTDYYFIAPDLRGFGKTEHTKNSLGYFFYEYQADLKVLFDYFAPNDPAMILGHSMGGAIASLFAGTFPERVSHLINIEGFGIKDMGSDDGPKRLKKWVDEIGVVSDFKSYETIDELARRVSRLNPRLGPERALVQAKRLSVKTKEGYRLSADPKHRWVHPYLFQLPNVFAFWKSITAQCLLIHADDTEMKTWMTSEGRSYEQELDFRLKQFPANSRQAIISNSGHMIHLNATDQLVEAVKRFLVG